MSDTTVPTLGYFKARGVSQPIRLLLKYKGVDFIDKHYDSPGADTDEAFKGNWVKAKFTLGLDFPNVPYYIDGEVKLTKSTVIMRYVARKHGLMATDETGLTRQDVLEQQLMDIRSGYSNLLQSKDYETEKIKYVAKTLPQQLDSLCRFLGTRQWFTGNHINYVDFIVYEQIDVFRLLSLETVNKYQNLVQFLTRFESLPAIKAYMKSPEFISWPITGPAFPWGFKKLIYIYPSIS
ncbi:unnamed protein product [Medioppia subpectinata]|uniref:glutathione transferase n=1 Tax=Medioppia subpectinata TaxID=1979941 RepID=A0A7R9PVV1_9ACAR|nr:unnamed protein product [Medioppia subpectinata]CAG2103056.1 unnamed protein product [Medioppia subpectinata]